MNSMYFLRILKILNACDQTIFQLGIRRCFELGMLQFLDIIYLQFILNMMNGCNEFLTRGFRKFNYFLRIVQEFQIFLVFGD